MVSPPAIFVGVGVIALIGFFAALLAKRGHFPDVLVLVLLGIVIGPLNTHVLRWGDLAEVIAALPLEGITPFFGALALAVIMFDAGINLHAGDMARGLRRAAAHTTAIFVLTAAGVAAVCVALLGFPIPVGILFGAIVGGISTAVVVSVARDMPMSPDTQALLTLECIVVDVLTIATAVAVIEALRVGALDGALVAESVVQSLSVGIVVGLVAGFVFVIGLPRLRGVANLYVLALGALLGAYGVIELLGGSGPLGVLAFGMVLGNSRNPLFGGRDLGADLTDDINRFHAQTSFLVRTFFFVLLGMTFSLAVFEHTADIASPIPFLSALNGTAVLLALGIMGVFGVIVAGRAIVVRRSVPPADRVGALLVVGRGLGSAVLATFPFTIADYGDPTSAYARALSPYEALLPTLTSVIVILTILTTAVGKFVVMRGTAKARRVDVDQAAPPERVKQR